MNNKIVLAGNKNLLKPAITQILAMHQLLEQIEVDATSSINEDFDPGRRYHPLIILHFREDSDFRPGTNQPKGRGQNRTKGEVSFRLMSETTETISEAELTNLGTRIKQIFGANGGYLWSKGKEMYCYADWSRGYQMQILARSEAQVRDLVTKILSLQNHTPQWKYLTKNKNASEAERYPVVPQTKLVMGKQVELPERRPNRQVRFRYAEARINPLLKTVILFDRTGKKTNALVK
ncbi:hypothetical protein IQ230_23475 [Gloeocapsopsis crepidinum LEGE 06123]|uniref:Uncharacterized protein n=1 Tax=Gloeocapsopsis crepidinum LEGE 06123 TaxID=588587 RepID=A0ABR9UY88_9CHRO|nr:hypothetical protein [Gloeocapsopsis crepidinum]MBE9193251.1 hypothetical protein [Gloeocapsopsis crepidinum LEGE 06123]